MNSILELEKMSFTGREFGFICCKGGTVGSGPEISDAYEEGDYTIGLHCRISRESELEAVLRITLSRVNRCRHMYNMRIRPVTPSKEPPTIDAHIEYLDGQSRSLDQAVSFFNIPRSLGNRPKELIKYLHAILHGSVLSGMPSRIIGITRLNQEWYRDLSGVEIQDAILHSRVIFG